MDVSQSEGSAAYGLEDLRNWPAATAGQNPPLRLAVFGDPVAHSASPPMQNAALAACGIAARYARIHVRPAELAEAFGLIARHEYIGVNLTIPHKTAALALLGGLDSHAALLGAVNTVRLEPGGVLRGFNTDGPGFVRAVREAFGVELSALCVLILGAGGGAGRALAAQCVIEGCPRVLLANRTHDKAEALARGLMGRAGLDRSRVEAVPWTGQAFHGAVAGADLIVNASSLGLNAGDGSPIPQDRLSARHRVFDTVYRADGAPTQLIAAAASAGARTAGGRALLLHQGALSFEYWFGRPAPLEAMRAALTASG